jgi:hypothetical protein
MLRSVEAVNNFVQRLLTVACGSQELLSENASKENEH